MFDTSVVVDPELLAMVQDATKGATNFERREKSDAIFQVTFEERPRLDAVHSTKDKPVYVVADYIHIHTPGDKTTVISREVDDEIRRRFGRQYAAWKHRRETSMLAGTPLIALSHTRPPILNVAQVATLQAQKVLTVEQLANLSDGQAQQVMLGGLTARDQAQRYLSVMQAQAPGQALSEAMATKDKEIAALQERLAKMEAMLEQATKPADKNGKKG